MRELLAYSKESILEEKLTLRIKADNSGDIYLPTAGYSSEGLQSCDYDWKVSIDGGEETEYNGVGSNGGKIRVGYGLNPLSVHTVVIKPIREKYGWLRAFGYKGTDITSSLINIISDKSYKGYAVSSVFTGDWYKAYQYYGCNSLINTDEELLPDTLEVIGNNYRYYEYAGCTSLVSNSDEKILKTVKAIGDNYRAYQYQNCTAINNINIRAINWASVGNNYRYNQFSGIGTDRNLVDIYVEGGIEEGGDWGLNNDTVKGIYVYKDLVSDYQTKLSTITSSKIQKNDEWDSLEYEFIEYIALADSTGKIRIPVGGFSTSFTQDCAYDWMVSIDGGVEEEISGTGGQTYVSVGSDLVEGSEHRVIIKPKTLGWGWGRAFGYLGTGAQAYIKELIHDSYKCFAVGRLDTGAHYKHGTFAGCTNLINSYEKLPTSVTTIGDYYMKECYAGCTGLITAFWEVLHKDCNVGVDYRHHEYTGCSNLAVYQGMAGYTKGAYPTNYKYEYLAGAGNDMDVYITRKEILPDNVVLSYNSLERGTTYTYNVTLTGTFKFSCMVWADDTDFGHIYFNLEKNGESLVSYDSGQGKPSNYNILLDIDATVGDVITFGVSRNSYGRGSCTDVSMAIVNNTIGLDDNRISNVYCHINDIFDYKESANWCVVASKLKGWLYDYVCHDFIDINRYTKLVTSVSLPAGLSEFAISNGWTDGNYNRGIGVNRFNNWNNIAVGVTEQSRTQADGGSGYRVGIVELNTTSEINSDGDRVLTGFSFKKLNKIGGAYGYSGNASFCDAINFDINGELCANFGYAIYTNDVAGVRNVAQWINMYSPLITNNLSSAISRNGQFIFAASSTYGWGFYFTKTPHQYPLNINKERGLDTIYGNLMFSDDGLTMVCGNEDWSKLTQYKLTLPRDLTTAVSDNKELNLSGQVSLSNDCRYLFRFDNDTNTIYQYTYE